MARIENCRDYRSLRDIQAIRVQLDHIHNDVRACGLSLAANLIAAAILAVAEEIEGGMAQEAKARDQPHSRIIN